MKTTKQLQSEGIFRCVPDHLSINEIFLVNILKDCLDHNFFFWCVFLCSCASTREPVIIVINPFSTNLQEIYDKLKDSLLPKGFFTEEQPRKDVYITELLNCIKEEHLKDLEQEYCLAEKIERVCIILSSSMLRKFLIIISMLYRNSTYCWQSKNHIWNFPWKFLSLEWTSSLIYSFNSRSIHPFFGEPLFFSSAQFGIVILS